MSKRTRKAWLYFELFVAWLDLLERSNTESEDYDPTMEPLGSNMKMLLEVVTHKGLEEGGEVRTILQDNNDNPYEMIFTDILVSDNNANKIAYKIINKFNIILKSEFPNEVEMIKMAKELENKVKLRILEGAINKRKEKLPEEELVDKIIESNNAMTEGVLEDLKEERNKPTEPSPDTHGWKYAFLSISFGLGILSAWKVYEWVRDDGYVTTDYFTKPEW